MPAPPICPPNGVTVAVDSVRNRDGDTPMVRVRGGGAVWAVRLLECSCPELHRGSEESKAIARQAKDFADDVVENCDDLRWHVPFTKDMTLKDMNILKALTTFDRIYGYIYVGPTQTLNQMLVIRRLASTTLHGKLGE